MAIDYTSACFKNPLPRWNSQHVSLMSTSSKRREAVQKEIGQVSEKLLCSYTSVLSPDNRTRAKVGVMGKESVQDYLSYFLTNVLLNYRIWEVDETWLQKLQALIEANNPEWKEKFLSDKSFKFKSWKR